MPEPAISLRRLGKMYKLYRSPGEKVLDVFGLSRLFFWRRNQARQFWALRELDLEVQPGERIGLIGRNGAGKSTLLKLICGLAQPTEGTAQVHGKVQALMELGTGFHPEFTGRQNLRASLAYQGLRPAEIARAEEEILDFAELDDFIDQPVKSYSAGMYARLAFATSTALRPEILIIDEILGAGDAYFAGKCLERMRRITDESGATVLFVSHDLGSVQRLCTRVVWVERGRIRQDGDPLAVIKAYTDQVRRDEDLRLKARDLRLQKAQTAVLGQRVEMYETHLFHLVTDQPHPTRVHRVRRLRLLGDGRELGAIEVGAPMDNVASQLHFLLDGPSMDWSEPVKTAGAWARCYQDCGGQYRHAPFQFSIPGILAREVSRYVVEIEGDFDPREAVHLERHLAGEYVRLGTLRPGRGVQEFAFASGAAAPSVPAAEVRVPDEYGNRQVVLTSVKLLDAQGQERRIFETGDKCLVELCYEARTEVEDPAFVFAIYLPDGQCASQLWARGSELGQPRLSGRGTVHFAIERLGLGRSAYIASAGIFQELSQQIEARAYHVLDRCIHFQVAPPPHLQYPERGLTPLDYTSRLVVEEQAASARGAEIAVC